MKAPASTSLMLLSLLLALPVEAQEFASVTPPLEDRFADAFLEHGLPPRDVGLAASALAIRWHGVADLDTRSLSLAFGVRAARFAAGVSQVGSGEVGWSAIALGLGAATSNAAAGMRACARAPADPLRLSSAEGGIELGAGAWSTVGESLELWASAPQFYTDGAPPPLERWLEIGVTGRVGDTRLWAARAMAPVGARSSRGEHSGGLSLELGPTSLWAEMRDKPLRARVGLVAAFRRIEVGAGLESHPVLDETIRLRLAYGAIRP